MGQAHRTSGLDARRHPKIVSRPLAGRLPPPDVDISRHPSGSKLKFKIGAGKSKLVRIKIPASSAKRLAREGKAVAIVTIQLKRTAPRSRMRAVREPVAASAESARAPGPPRPVSS
jgi:hypothetical protein